MLPDGPAPGSLILHYRILRPIGSGGMGVVYEAEDTKLGRRVALKFLPPQLASDPAALERFAREARAASALNHPNICTIHAIEDAGTSPFIAMELLDGESLDKRIATRPLAWNDIIETGLQIAGALDAAHRQGIIHRDIKPANIFLTPDGRAKVLDFGVAKVVQQHLAQGETMGAVTARQALTEAGSTVGTIAYMSPEQARGEELDARSDIFSLAAVLYEMSTGRRAFDGKTSAIIFNKILEGTPAPPRELNPTLPPRLEDVILRGLEKDRDLRHQTAGDLRAELKRLKRDASEGRLAFVPAASGAAGAVTPSSGAVIAAEARRHKGVAATVAVVALAVLTSAGYGLYSWLQKPPREDAPVASFATPTRITTTGDVRGCGSISPDGKYIVYCDFAGQLKLRQIATGAVVPLGKLTGHTAFSPDSDFVYVTVANEEYPGGVLLRIGALGGEPRRVATSVSGAAAVSPDGKQVAFVRINTAKLESAIVIADALGGNERNLAVSKINDTWFEAFGLSWSQDGALLSATQATVVGGYRLMPAVVHVDNGKIERVGSQSWTQMGRTTWLPQRSGILFTGAEGRHGAYQFWTVSYPGGAVRRITNDSRGFGNTSVSVTADGTTAVTVPTDIVSNIFATDATATAPLEQWTSGVKYDGGSGMSAARDRVFYTSFDGTDLSIWSVEEGTRRARRLTAHYAEVPSTPDDGSFVAFQAIHEDRFRIWRADPDGSNARVLSQGQDDIMPMVSPDGRWIYYWAAAEPRVMRMAADGTQARPVTSLPVAPGDVSPDGRLLLLRATDPSLEVSHLVLDAETGEVRARIDMKASLAAWARDSRTVTLLRDDNGVSNLWEQPITGGPPRPLTRFTSGTIFGFAYSPDRTRLYLARGQVTGDVVALKNFR